MPEIHSHTTTNNNNLAALQASGLIEPGRDRLNSDKGSSHTKAHNLFDDKSPTNRGQPNAGSAVEGQDLAPPIS